MKKLLLGLISAVGLLIAAVGCGRIFSPGYLTGDYGIPPPPEHPTVRLTDFSYTPPSPIHFGDTLTLTAITNKPAADAGMYAYLPTPTGNTIALKDDGQPPDAAANDGVWTAAEVWTEGMGALNHGQLFVVLDFSGEYASQSLTYELTVLPEEGK